VGSTGTVRAVELRAESLAFLRIRSRRDHLSAICAIHGDAAGDDVARGAALDAVLISNTWHELVRPESVLRSVWRSLRPGGRLVVLDQGPASAQSETWLEGRDRHEVPSDLVRRALTGQGFEIVSSDDRFIEGGDDHGHWWLVVARKPQAVAATTRD
jgi:SAM-dependent methyltransferase